LKINEGSEREGVYDGASGSASSFLCRRVVDSWRHCTLGRREGCRVERHVRRSDLLVDIVQLDA
jgi:hypothetical protein